MERRDRRFVIAFRGLAYLIFFQENIAELKESLPGERMIVRARHDQRGAERTDRARRFIALIERKAPDDVEPRDCPMVRRHGACAERFENLLTYGIERGERP